MVTYLGHGYDVEGLNLAITSIEKLILDGYASTFQNVNRWHHDTHPH